MSDAYKIINESFKLVRRDVLFSPSLLDQLTYEERNEVEEKIVKYCFLGDKASFKYIPYLKTKNLKEVFSESAMSKVSIDNRVLIYKILFETTGNKVYLTYLYDLAKIDLNAYSLLTLSYMNSKEEYKDLYYSLERLSYISEQHKNMFDVRCKNNEKEGPVK